MSPSAIKLPVVDVKVECHFHCSHCSSQCLCPLPSMLGHLATVRRRFNCLLLPILLRAKMFEQFEKEGANETIIRLNSKFNSSRVQRDGLSQLDEE